MKVKDLIAQEVDIDVYDDVCEELGIAFCGPMTLTPEGQDKFAEVLEYDVELHNDGGDVTAIVKVDAPGDEWKHRLALAKEFFEGAAGYCTCEEYDKWFAV